MVQYIIKGEGFPIVLLHGNGGNYHEFDQLVNLLPNYKFICINARYTNKQDLTKQYTFEMLNEDVQEVLTSLDIHHYGIIGFSDGGIQALEIASNNDEVAFIIALGANTRANMIKDSVFYMFILQNILFNIFSIYHPVARKKKKLYSLMLNQTPITKERLENIQCPSLILAGEHDLIKEEDTRFIADSIPNSILKIIPNANHFLLEDAFKLTFKEINSFLKAYFEVNHD